MWGYGGTHSAFGLESFNGHLKHLFHSRANVIDQLVFNIDVQQTLQLVYPLLNSKCGHLKNMQKIYEHTFIVGNASKKLI